MIANPVRVEGSDSTDNGGLMYAWSLQNPDIAKIITVSLGILIGADCTIRFFGPLTEHMVVFASSTLLSSAFIFVLVFSPPLVAQKGIPKFYSTAVGKKSTIYCLPNPTKKSESQNFEN